MTAPDVRSERGSVAPFVAVAAVSLLLCTGLLVDGAARLRAAGRAEQVAGEAARAATEAVDARGPLVRFDRPRALRAARAYLRAAGADGTVTITADGTADVTTALHGRYLILGPLVGADGFTATGHAEATLLVGATGGEP